MSRYRISNENYEVAIVGWDPPMNTYFYQIFKTEDDYEEGREYRFGGIMIGSIDSVEKLVEMISKYISIPDHIKELLVKDAETEGNGFTRKSQAMQNFLKEFEDKFKDSLNDC